MPCAADPTSPAAVDALDAEARALFPQATAGPGVARLNDSLDWFRLVETAALPDRHDALYLTIRDDDAVVGVVPMLRGPNGSLRGFTTPYTCLYQPPLAAGLAPTEIRRIGAAVAACDADVLQFDALDPQAAWLAPFCLGLRDGGRVLLRYDHFGNWWQDLGQGGWPGFLADRPGALRETIRRRSARVARDPELRLEIIAEGDDLERGIGGFEAVYARSWKQAEPHPAFNPAMIRMAARLGLLRLGLLWQREQVIAAQYWVVVDGTAQVLKLAHDSQADALSPGTVLTAWMIRQMIEADQITGLDFGRGDDAYKRQWASLRRARIGVVAVDPWSREGAKLLIRHALGGLRRRVRLMMPLM